MHAKHSNKHKHLETVRIALLSDFMYTGKVCNDNSVKYLNKTMYSKRLSIL